MALARAARCRADRGQGLALALIGIAAGLAGAYAVTRAMTGLVRVRPMDLLRRSRCRRSLMAVALVATLVPARRASALIPRWRCVMNDRALVLYRTVTHDY
jgi:hypothetical protein